MFLKLKNPFRPFSEDQRGSLSVEAVLILPILFWAICATYTFFHAFKVQNAANRANYTISDILSRETDLVNADYINGLHNLYEYMSRNRDGGTWIRVSVVTCRTRCDKENRQLVMEWSQATGSATAYGSSDIGSLEQYIPQLPKGDSLTMVETSSDYEPMFQGIVPNFGSRKLVSQSVTRPRFTQQLVWDDGSGGSV